MSALVPRERLAAVLGMLGSDHDGEIAAAGRQATRMIKAAGTTWLELLTPPAKTPPPPPPPPPRGWRADLATCRARLDALTEWERGFVLSLLTYRNPPTARQRAVLAGIAGRFCENR